MVSFLANKAQALVKVEEDEDDSEKIPRLRPQNKDLPQELTTGDLWTKNVLPTFIRWFAAQKHPWTPAAKDIPNIQNALQLICRHFVGDDYQLPDETSAPEFQVVSFYFPPCILSLINL